MTKGNLCNWTQEEDKYLEELMEVKMADGSPFPATAIHIFFNNYFVGLYNEYQPRSYRAISKRIGKVDSYTEVKGAEKPKAKKEPIAPVLPTKVRDSKVRGRPHWDTTVPNGGRGWAIAEVRYLVNNWTSDDDTRQDIANELGRTVCACAAKYSVTSLKNGGRYITDLLTPVEVDVSVTNEMGMGVITRFINWLYSRNQRRVEKKSRKAHKRNEASNQKKHKAKQKEISNLHAEIARLEGN